MAAEAGKGSGMTLAVVVAGVLAVALGGAVWMRGAAPEQPAAAANEAAAPQVDAAPPEAPLAETSAPEASMVEAAAPEAAAVAESAEVAAEGEAGSAEGPVTDAVEGVDAPETPEATVSAEVPVTQPALAPVTIGNWRVEADGAGLVAGKAAPGVEVAILVDGAEVARATSTAGGEFVALFTLAEKETPSLLTLSAALPDGTALPVPEAIALAPVGGDAAPAGLLLAEDGVEVQAAAPPEAQVAEVSITALAIAPDGAVQINGQAGAGQVVRLYLNEALVQDATVAEDGRWRVDLPSVAPGDYVLRADQIDGQGAVTARAERAFSRTAPVVVAAAEPVAPVDEAGAEQDVAPAMAQSTPAPVTDAPVADVPAQDTPEAGAAADSSAAAEAAPTPAPQAVTITVEPGFTLWQIAREKYGDGVLYVQVFEANRDQIRDPDLIYPGQVFTLPAQ